MPQTFDDVKSLLSEQAAAIAALHAIFNRQETFHDVTFHWSLTHYCSDWTIGTVDDAERGGNHYRPALWVETVNGLCVRLPQLPGPALGRYAELKTALEAWLTGTGPWPEPKGGK